MVWGIMSRIKLLPLQTVRTKTGEQSLGVLDTAIKYALFLHRWSWSRGSDMIA